VPFAAVLLPALVLSGCGVSFDKYFGTDKPPPAPAQSTENAKGKPAATTGTAESTTEAQDPPGGDKPFPNLGSVPQTRPVRQSIDEQRQAIQQGLVADRQNARYTDQVIRHEPVSTTPPARPVTAAATNVPRLPGAPAPAQQPAQAKAPVPAAKAAPPPSSLPQPAVPALPGAQTAAAPAASVPSSGAPIPIAPPPAGQQAPPQRSFAPPPSAAAAPPPPAVAAQQSPPPAAPGRSNFTLGTAVVQAIETPPEPADAPWPPPPQLAAAAPAPIPKAGSAIAQAPSAPPSAAAPAAGASGASIYQPPQAPRAPATMAGVAQSGFQPPPPPLIPGQASPLPSGSSGAGTTAWSAQGAARGAPQIAAVPPPPSSYTPQQSAPAPNYPQQPSYPPQAAYPPPMPQSPPPNPYAAAARAPQQPMPSPSPLRPPPPPISPALPAMTGGDPIAEARMRAASVNYDPVAEARARTAQGAGQQVGLILFQNGSASLGANDRDLLQRVAVLARQNGSIVRVVGHASGRTGEMDMSRHQNKNLDISMTRANAAAAALRAAGVPAERIVVEAKGDSEPVYRETMPSGEAGNRRVDVYLQ